MSTMATETETTTRRPDDPNALITITVATVGAVMVLLSGIVLLGYYHHAEEKENQTKVIAQAPAELTEVRAEQNARLACYRWVDSKKGIVSIPIDRAMETVVRDMRASAGKKP